MKSCYNILKYWLKCNNEMIMRNTSIEILLLLKLLQLTNSSSFLFIPSSLFFNTLWEQHSHTRNMINCEIIMAIINYDA